MSVARRVTSMSAFCFGRLTSESEFKSALSRSRKMKASPPRPAMDISSKADAKNAFTLMERLPRTRNIGSAFRLPGLFVNPDAHEMLGPGPGGGDADHLPDEIIAVLVLGGYPQFADHLGIGAVRHAPSVEAVHERIEIAVAELVRVGDGVEGGLRSCRGEFLLHALHHGDRFLAGPELGGEPGTGKP